MIKSLTVSEKKIVICVAMLFVILAISLFADIPGDTLIWAYIIGLIAIIASADIYAFYLIVSHGHKGPFSRISLHIKGISHDNTVCVEVDGKLVRRFVGEYNGSLKLRNGDRRVTFYNELFSVSADIEPAENLTIDIERNDSIATIDVGYKEMNNTSEELTERTRSDYRINMFLFGIINFLMVLAILRLLFIFDII
jgi:hypothetical protein